MLNTIREAVLRGDTDRAAEITVQALHEGISPQDILSNSLISAMQVVGEEFESGVRFIPEMLISAEAMKSAMTALRPHLIAAGVPSQGCGHSSMPSSRRGPPRVFPVSRDQSSATQATRSTWTRPHVRRHP